MNSSLGLFRDHFGKLVEEGPRQLLRRALDQSASKLRKLATDLGLRVVAQQRFAIDFPQRDLRAPLGMARSTTIALARQENASGAPGLSSVTVPPNFAFTGPIFSTTKASR